MYEVGTESRYNEYVAYILYISRRGSSLGCARNRSIEGPLTIMTLLPGSDFTIFICIYKRVSVCVYIYIFITLFLSLYARVDARLCMYIYIFLYITLYPTLKNFVSVLSIK